MASYFYANTTASLGHMCDSISTINNMLAESVSTLHARSDDFDRLTRVAACNKCYELVGESEVRAAQYQLTSNIEPQIRSLLDGAEAGLSRLQERAIALHNANEATQGASREAETYNDEAEAVALREARQQKETMLREIKRLDLELSRKTTILAGLQA